MVEWSNRGGPGYVRVLKDRTTGRVRLVFRNNGVRKVWLNANVHPEDKWLPNTDVCDAIDAAGRCCAYWSAHAISAEGPMAVAFVMTSVVDASEFTRCRQSHLVNCTI